MELEKKVYLFTADWCTRCPNIKNKINEKEADVTILDVEEYGDIAGRLQFMSVPTIVDNREGKELVHAGEGACFSFIMSNYS